MIYMDEWEYNLWLELHKDELLAAKVQDPRTRRIRSRRFPYYRSVSKKWEDIRSQNA